MTAEPSTPDTPQPAWKKTACILCECNCGLEVQVTDRSLTKIRGDKEHPGSAGYTCEKPLRLEKYQNGRHRIDTPLRRRADGSYEEIDWDTALDEIAAELAAVRDAHGGDKIFFYGGGGQGNHLGGSYGRALFHAVGAEYMSNALAQEKTGEGWVDQHLYGNHTSGDFEHTEVAIFIGKNPWQSHGVARARPVLKELAKDPERAMIVIDPRRSETAQMADIHLQLKPGTDAWCVSAIAATLVQEDLHAQAWLQRHTTGSHDVLAVLRRIDIADHARVCGVAEEQIRAAARRVAAAKSAATYEDLGVQQSPNSTLVSYLNKMMWMLTGNFAKPGGVHIHSWMFPIAGRWHPVPSEQGPPPAACARARLATTLMKRGATPLLRAVAAAARSPWSRHIADRGADVALGMFFEPVSVPAARRIADTLGRPDANGTTPVSGANIVGGLIPCNAITDEIVTDHPDRLRAMWIDASNPAHSLAESDRFREAMRSLELTVVVDVAMTETARQADYVLPAASQFEKHEASLFTLHFPHNTFQLRAPLMAPLPGTRTEPDIYAAIIDRLGVVEARLLDDLTAAARVSRRAFALAFFSAIEQRPELAGLVPYLLYKTLGATLPEGERSVALIWGLAHLCAIAQPDAVARAGFSGRGFAQGEQLFDAIHTRGEGVLFAEDRYEDAWGYIQHPDGKIHAAIPELLEELARIAATEPSYTSDEFPFTLSAGERRSFTANVIIRDPEWRRRDKEGALRISEADAGERGLHTGDTVRVVTATGAAETSVEVSDMMQPGHISLPNGMGVTYPDDDNPDHVVGVAPNALTSGTRRDKFFGTPWHKNVPARIEPLPAARATGDETAA
ncbi:molybdopterin-dependent oxidoreductase [Haloechinothrix sp. YIM 98757]|uniref:Molybdopterin-dependent oxidoreductase n=2 Tax=Haloechinothrix aidingensis TaxID=2752311 RepID=A0A838AA41_9PSEU|nr:molybdopterin-dependent oxidoreductase [Haloechinothrix aidingensis]MBA0125861.1 molybdopterin-dependent oxidoreductase [Haloechinothrix aidingensis]